MFGFTLSIIFLCDETSADLTMSALTYLYEHWAPMCLPMAILVGIILRSFLGIIPEFQLLIWLQVPVYLIHQFEEHAWPGGFKDFINKKIFKQEEELPLNNMSIFWINIPVVWIGFPLGAAFSLIYPDVSIWIIYTSLINGIIHVLGAIRFREYDPGFIVSLLFNVPLSIYTLIRLPDLVAISPLTHIISITIALLVHAAIIVYAIRQLRK